MSDAPHEPASCDARWSHAVFAAGVLVYAIDLALYRRAFSPLSYGLSYILEWSNAPWRALLRVVWQPTYYPPLYDTFIKSLVLGIGFDYPRILLSGSVFVIGGALYTMLLALRLGAGRFSFVTGLVALFLPGSFAVARVLCIEAPLLLFVPAFCYHLVASRGLVSRGHSLLAGLFAGLGLLTKWSFPAFVIGPLLAVFVIALRGPENKSWRGPTRTQAMNLAAAAALALALSAWWYLARFDPHVFALSARNTPDAPVYSFWRAFSGCAANLGILLGERRTAFWIALGLAGLALSRRPTLVLSAAALGLALPLATFSLPVHAELRYLYPLVPAAALVAGLVAGTARWLLARWALAAATVALALVSHFDILAAGETRMKAVFNLGYSSEVELFLGYLERALPPRTEGPWEVVVHPAWKNFHLDCTYLLYAVERRELAARFRVSCFETFNYARYRDRLRAGGYDVVFLDCGPDGDCLATNRRAVDRAIRWLSGNGNINQMTGEYSPRFTVDDLEQDREYLRAHFRRALYLPLNDGTFTEVWVRRAAPG